MTEKDKKSWRDAGYHFTWGVLGAIGTILLIVMAVQFAYNAFNIGTDDCDRSAWHRCGMRVLTDAKTGQQYLVTSGGGITPRLPR